MATPFPDKKPYDKQSIEVPGTRRPGETGHYRNAIWGLVKLDERPFKTLLDAFNHGLSIARDKPFLGHRPVVSQNPLKRADHYVWETYAQVNERKTNVGSYIEHLFSAGALRKDGELDTVGLWMQNRPEWQIVHLATHAYKKVSVSLYDTLGKNSIEYIIQHAHLTIIFTTADHAPQLFSMSKRVPMLKIIVIIDTLQRETKEILQAWANSLNIKLYDFAEFEKMGAGKRLATIVPDPDHLATICYTSGTTGNPKGVLLTHRNLMAGSDSFLHGIDSTRYYRLFSYLPLAHIYERISEIDIMKLGGSIGYFSGDILKLTEDAQILKPTYFPTVPRILNRVYQAAMLAGQTPTLKGFLFRTAVDTKLKHLRKTGEVTHPFWDKVVFQKIRDIFGGQMHLITIGSAPVSVEAMDFFKVAFACDILEEESKAQFLDRYGMTENCAAGTSAWPLDPSSSGTMGPPKSANEIKLIDVPHLGYTVNDMPYPRGEICLRGDNCFKAYYKDEEATRDSIDEEGWVHTGDVGAIDDHGRFIFIDRVKNIIKLSQGEFVALDKIQNIYSRCPLITQLFVHGDPLRDHLVAIVVPDPEQFVGLVSRLYKIDILPGEFSRLKNATSDPQVLSAVLEEMNKEARSEKLKGFELIRNMIITLEPFSVENGLLTPTLKIRRRDAYARYKSELERLYTSAMPASLTTSKL